MRAFDDPSDLSPDQRLRQLAGILAAGLLRLHGRPADSADCSPLKLKSLPKLASQALSFQARRGSLSHHVDESRIA